MSAPVPQPSLHPPRARGRSRSRAWLAILLMLVFTLGAAFGGYQLGAANSAIPVWDPVWLRGYLDRPVDTSVPGQGFWVAGYWVDYDLESLRTLQQRSPHLDQVIAFSYGFAADGSLQGRDPYVLRGVVAQPKRVLLFANLTDNDFSADTVRVLLTDPAARARSQQAMVAKAREYGAAGIQLDFEGVPRELRSELTSYVRDLSQATRAQGLSLSMAVPAKVADLPDSSWSGAFDYPALGALLDEMYIMAYDEHYRLGPPGPVASLPWTERVIRYAISVVPTKKIVLGIPGYGYDWTTSSQPQPGPAGAGGAVGGGSGSAGARTVTGRNADRLLGQTQAQVQWDPTVGENVAVYGSADQAHTVWFPDQRSLQAKLDLARQYNLKGVALWRLGLEPLTYWEPMAVWRQTPEEDATPVTAPPPSGGSTP